MTDDHTTMATMNSAPTPPTPSGGAHRVETIDVRTDGQPWLEQRVISLALRRRDNHLSIGEGICPILDARPSTDGVRVDLRVPADARGLSAVRGLGAVHGAVVSDVVSIDQVHHLLGPIVESLCALHDAGLAHGGVTLSAIHRRRDGRGILIGFHPDATPEQDVSQMAGLILDLVTPGSLDAQSAALLTRAVDPEPRNSPGMVDLAVLLKRMARTPRMGEMSAATSPPARRRPVCEHPTESCDGVATQPIAVAVPPDPATVRSPRLDDPIHRLRRDVVSPAQHRSNQRGGHRARRTRSGSATRSVPWPIVSAMVGSSTATWIIAGLLR